MWRQNHSVHGKYFCNSLGYIFPIQKHGTLSTLISLYLPSLHKEGTCVQWFHSKTLQDLSVWKVYTLDTSKYYNFLKRHFLTIFRFPQKKGFCVRKFTKCLVWEGKYFSSNMLWRVKKWRISCWFNKYKHALMIKCSPKKVKQKEQYIWSLAKMVYVCIFQNQDKNVDFFNFLSHLFQEGKKSLLKKVIFFNFWTQNPLCSKTGYITRKTSY